MKARKKNSNDEWSEVKYVQLENSDILYKQEYLEFDTLSAEPKTNEQNADEKHWQDVRESAAIAALQGLCANSKLVSTGTFETTYDISVHKAIELADALIEQLKKK